MNTGLDELFEKSEENELFEEVESKLWTLLNRISSPSDTRNAEAAGNLVDAIAYLESAKIHYFDLDEQDEESDR